MSFIIYLFIYQLFSIIKADFVVIARCKLLFQLSKPISLSLCLGVRTNEMNERTNEWILQLRGRCYRSKPFSLFFSSGGAIFLQPSVSQLFSIIKADFVVLRDSGRCDFFFDCNKASKKKRSEMCLKRFFLFPVLSYKKRDAENHIVHIASIVFISNLQNYIKKC